MNKNDYAENTVTLILPKDTTKLEEKYSEVLAEIVGEILTIEELEYVINKLKKRENGRNGIK